jgi:hypothetical protein
VLTTIAPARHENLTSLERARAELRRCAKDDDWLRTNIYLVSQAIAEHLERPLTRRVVEERLTGQGGTTMLLSMTPVAALGSVTGIGYDSPLDLTDGRVGIRDGAAGVLWRENGWPNDSPWSTRLTTDQGPLLGQATWTVRYTGGWLVPDDDLPGAGVTVAVDGTLTLPSGVTAPLLVPGDVLRLSGFAAGTDGPHLVTARTASTITVGSTLVAGTGDAGARIAVRNLPAGLERVAFDALLHWASARGRDTGVTSERIGDWAATYGSRENAALDTQASTLLPRAVLNGLRKWERVA